MVLFVTRLVIPKCLLCVAEVVVQLRDLRVELQYVADHRIDFVWKEHPQLLADYFDAERVDRADDGFMRMLEGLEPGADVLTQLADNHAVEGDDQHLVAVDREPSG